MSSFKQSTKSLPTAIIMACSTTATTTNQNQHTKSVSEPVSHRICNVDIIEESQGIVPLLVPEAGEVHIAQHATPYVSVAAVNVSVAQGSVAMVPLTPAVAAAAAPVQTSNPPQSAPVTIKRPKFYSRLLDILHHSPLEHQPSSRGWGEQRRDSNNSSSSEDEDSTPREHHRSSRASFQRLSRFLDFITPKGRLIPASDMIIPAPPVAPTDSSRQNRRKSNNNSPSSSSSKHNLSDDEFEVLRERITTIQSQDELEFSQKYRFIGTKVIGRGASGVVRLACCHSCTDRKLAVKEFRKRRKDESPTEYLRKLTSEFCIASRMHHCNVVKTIDIVHDGSKWYEVMEYCPGGDLFSVIQRGELGIDEIDCCFKQLIEGVQYLHSLGVAHRDLKPENLLIDQSGHLKIADFGVSDVFTPAGATGACKSRGLCGSSPYIAPEEYLSEEYDGRLVDVWSIGIIYFAMIFHTVPWESASPKDPNYRGFVEGGPMAFEPFRRLPYGPRQLLIRILQADPSKRITIEEIMEDEWFRNIQTCTIPVHHANK